MVPGDGVFQENSNKIPRQIRENREIIGFIHPSFANEVLKENTAETVLVPIGGEIGIRTLAGPEAHYRFSRPTPSATWVFLRLCLVLPAGLEPAT